MSMFRGFFGFFFQMCLFCDDKSQAFAGDNNTKCLTAFLTIVWHSVCLIIVSITHTGELLLKRTQQWLSACVPSILQPSRLSSLCPQVGQSNSVLCGKFNSSWSPVSPGDIFLPSEWIGKQNRKSWWRISERSYNNNKRIIAFNI